MDKKSAFMNSEKFQILLIGVAIGMIACGDSHSVNKALLLIEQTAKSLIGGK